MKPGARVSPSADLSEGREDLTVADSAATGDVKSKRAASAILSPHYNGPQINQTETRGNAQIEHPLADGRAAGQ